MTTEDLIEALRRYPGAKVGISVMDPDAAERRLAELAALQTHTQAELLPADVTLTEARAETCLEAAAVPESGTKPVPESGSSFPIREQARGQGPAKSLGKRPVVPESGTSLNGTVSLNNCASALSNEANDSLKPEEECRLMAAIAAVVGAEGMAYWGADWRKNWVRKHPKRVAAALDEFRQAQRTGWRPRNAGAALKDIVKRFTQNQP